MANPAAAVWRPIVTEILREQIGAGEPAWLPVRGRSMRPHLSRGTRILVSRTTRIRPGDLLAYKCEGAIVCHRVLGRRGIALLTRADHRGAEAERVMPAQIVGVVVALQRAGVVIDLTTRTRRALALVVAARSIVAAGWARARRRWRRPS
jgi:Peptidase S24-like